ncbi:MAG: hypothetical protein GF353_23265, partial [Candidatus Lokiarchaeota archaeon]|nr:hypothetical protein [Candidatus Lokiarchaeota archaeon]
MQRCVMKKKIGFVIIIFFRFIYSVIAQPSEFNWVKWAGGINEDCCFSISLDKIGNTVITGYYKDITHFWPYSFNSSGSKDIFVAKYDKLGNVLWAKSAGGSGYDEGHSIVSDESGNSIITGIFFGTAKFDEITLNSSGGNDIFVAKYSEVGNVLWAKGAGSPEADYGWSIETDTYENICVTGCFRKTARFDSISLSSAGDYDVFITKFDPSGDVLWAKKAGGPNSDIGHSIATDILGNIYITGEFTEIATFENNTIYGNGIFLAKYSSNGDLVWVKSANGTSTIVSNGVVVDRLENSFVTGNFSGIVNFGNYNLHSEGDNDIFISKYDKAGNVLWAKRAGGIANETSHDISIDKFDNPVIVGSFVGNSNFDNINLNSVSELPDICVVKYNQNGDVVWTKHAGGQGNDAGISIISDNDGTNLITGFFEETAAFDNIDINSAGDRDIFVAKFIETIMISDSIAPESPKNVQAIPGDSRITLSWDQNTELDLSYYNIYRYQNQGFTPTESNLLTTVLKPASDYIDLDVINDQTYYYRISAVDSSG